MSVLVLDIGSSSVRAILFDDEARPVPGAASQKAHLLSYEDGGATTDALALAGMVERTIDEVLAHPAARDIHAVGAAVFVNNVLGMGPDGTPVTPIYTYADTRSRDDVALLAAEVDPHAVHQRTGCRLHTAYSPACLHWLRRTQPGRWAAATLWANFGTYLYQRWFGAAVCSYSLASWSGLLDRGRLAWDAQWLELLGLPADALPPLRDYTAALHGLRPSYATRWPALREAPFLLAVGDGAAANVGSGAVQPDQLGLTLGTTGALRRILPPPATIPDGLWCYRLDAPRAILGGAIGDAGGLVHWASQALALPSVSEAEQALASRAPDSHGLTVVPLWFGERSPGWHVDATGAIHGLTAATTPLDLLQALEESVAHFLAVVADQLDSPDSTILAGGGAIHASPTWAQTICDALNREIRLVAEKEVTARGVALLALEATRGLGLAHTAPPIARVLSPRPEAARTLRAARERQMALYHRLYD